jgi:hypothetical protein
LSGQDALRDIAPLANWTRVVEHDLGSQVAGFYRYNTIGTLDVTAGWTQSPADAVMIALAIRLAAATGGAGTAGMAETNDTIWARGVAARNGGASMAVAGNSPAARGALTLKAMTALVGTSNAAVASAILPVAGTLGAVEARDMVSSAGGTRATAALGATLADVSLAADGAAAIAGRSTIILADAKMSASAAKPAVILRRAGSDGSDEFERHQREWRQDLRRVIDDAFGIAGSLVDPDMPGPPPDFAGLAGALHLRRQAMEQETVELLLAEEARRQEEDAMAILLLAA